MKRFEIGNMTSEECDKEAFDKLVLSVSACEQSTKKMIKKLEAAGYPAASIEYAISKAIDYGFIDDKRYCECLIRSTLAAGKGLSKIESEILSLGIDPWELDPYVEYMDSSEEEKLESALDYLERHRPRCKNIRDGAFRKLVSRGYSIDIASKASKA